MTVLVCVGVGAAFVAAVVVYALMRGAIAAARAEARATDRSVEGLRAEFASLAAATLEGKAKSLAEQNAAQVRPLFEQLTTRFVSRRSRSVARRMSLSPRLRAATRARATGERES